ncbi:MAG: ATP-binding cassette domain-containing protein, partial [Eubacteriales bacterium]
MLIACENISKDYGTKKLIENVSFYVDEGDKIGVIGINGTGKSTLLRIIAGVEGEDSGEVTRSSGVRVSYLAQ